MDCEYLAGSPADSDRDCEYLACVVRQTPRDGL